MGETWTGSAADYQRDYEALMAWEQHGDRHRYDRVDFIRNVAWCSCGLSQPIAEAMAHRGQPSYVKNAQALW